MSRKMKLVYGVGINDANYEVQTPIVVNGKLRASCPFYEKWSGMLWRCYSSKLHTKRPTYRGCSVYEEWLTFSKFKLWMETKNWENKHLDKDLLVRGNKVYSPDTCCFITKTVNTFMTEPNAKANGLPIGVTFDTKRDKFLAQISNPFNGRNEKLGRYSTPVQAHAAWLDRKIQFAKLLAEDIDDEKVSSALVSRYENYNSGFHNIDIEETFDYSRDKIPWPELSPEEKAVVNVNYENLHKMIREEDDEHD